ncbi:HET-domain-containing protein [Polychaeton citri CBS 116435]|uniref:HET-domain-containing protein n=1 Tax=Polychaeton citri CBS 116435 TaxID=1314669 RepID=A0A9P4QGG9_9PEZI|nr:HET-domain-containing protein [Polychaeton citri CBS 116435]
MQRARDWLKCCENGHLEFCEIPEGVSRPDALRVIDVQDMCVCCLPSGARYIALSYCWPADDPFKSTKAIGSELLQPTSLETRMQELPQTIQDAIHCVSELKERYLWVDSICIVQDCENDKRTQISQMDKVYNSAVLTIVAANSAKEYTTHSSKGLPRYKSFAEEIHPGVERIQGLRLVVPLPIVFFPL